jgi:hypothetical protein
MGLATTFVTAPVAVTEPATALATALVNAPVAVVDPDADSRDAL